MNVLIINSKFPPDTGVGSFRVAKFSKYLNRFGCNVHVLTMENTGGKSYSLMEDVEAVESVTRTDVMRSIPPFIHMREIRWIKPMIQTAIQMIHDNDIDVVLHSVPKRLLPVGCMPIKRKTNVPYVLDLRDPMSMRHESESPVDLKSSVYHWLTNFFEPRVFRCATKIVVTSNAMNEMYQEIYQEHSEKFHTIYNGFDAEDFEDLIAKESNGFEIVLPGKFRDDMEWFFEPFCDFVEDHPDVTFTHFGQRSRSSTKNVRTVVSNLGLEDYVSFEGYADRDHVFSVLMGANLGLAVAIPDDRICIPTKIFDYMGCNIPILAVDDGDSAMRDVLSDFPHAYCIKRNDPEAVLKALKTVYRDRPQTLGTPVQFEKYTRESTSREMYTLLDQCRRED